MSAQVYRCRMTMPLDTDPDILEHARIRLLNWTRDEAFMRCEGVTLDENVTEWRKTEWTDDETEEKITILEVLAEVWYHPKKGMR